jgi:hypothetical protein
MNNLSHNCYTFFYNCYFKKDNNGLCYYYITLIPTLKRGPTSCHPLSIYCYQMAYLIENCRFLPGDGIELTLR